MPDAVIVTGAAGGIGLALCERMNSDGYLTIGVDRRPSPGAAIQVELDLRETDAVRDFGVQIATEHSIKAVIHNAAVQPLAGVGETSTRDWISTFRVNVVAVDALVAGMRGKLAAADGSIVVIGSVHGRATTGGMTAYVTAKAALEGWVRSAALELGPSIRVNAIAPGAIDTAKLEEGFSRWGLVGSEERKAILRQRTALGRIGKASEVASAASFLIGDDSRFITGITLPVDGGASARLGSE